MRKKTVILIAAVCAVLASVVVAVVALNAEMAEGDGDVTETAETVTAVPEITESDVPIKDITDDIIDETDIGDDYIRSLIDKIDELSVEETRFRELVSSSGKDSSPVMCYMKNVDFLFLVISCRMRFEEELIENIDEKVHDSDFEGSVSRVAMLKGIRADAITQFETDKMSYRAIVSEKEAYMKSFSSAIENYNGQNGISAENTLKIEFEEYISMIQSHNYVVPSGDGFVRPLPESEGSITSPFGERELNGEKNYHGATDISCTRGVPIYASNSGKVIRAEWHPSYGHYVIIDHGGNVSTLYSHCSELAVIAGQTVEKGQIIGYIGNSGYAFGSHLHFEYRINGQTVDPEMYVSF